MPPPKPSFADMMKRIADDFTKNSEPGRNTIIFIIVAALIFVIFAVRHSAPPKPDLNHYQQKKSVHK